MKLLGAVAAAVVVAGCSYGPAPHKPSATSSAAATGAGVAEQSSGADSPVSIFPSTGLLGAPLTAKGATITPRADNLALMNQSNGDGLELGIEVSFTGVTTMIDATGPTGGFRLLVSGGDQIPTSRPAVIKSPPLTPRVRTDTSGWVFFHIKPGMLPTQLQLTAAPAGYGLEPAPLAIWVMPAKLPPASSPAPPPPPPPPPGAAPPPAPVAPPNAGGSGGDRGPRLPQLPPPPKLPPLPKLPPPPKLPQPQLPPVVCQHTPLC